MLDLSPLGLAWLSLCGALVLVIVLRQKLTPPYMSVNDIKELLAGPVALYEFPPMATHPIASPDLDKEQDVSNEANLREQLIRLEERAKGQERETSRLAGVMDKGFTSLGDGLKEQASSLNKALETHAAGFVNKVEFKALQDQVKLLWGIIIGFCGLLVLMVINGMAKGVTLG